MKKNVTIVVTVLCLLTLQSVFGQSRDQRLRTKGYVNPSEVVNFDSTMPFDVALGAMNVLSKQYAGKVIIDLDEHKQAIGIMVVNQHWRDALDLILKHHGLLAKETAEYINVYNTSALVTSDQGTETKGEPPPTLESRDVKISAVFF